ncbi:MAG: hypothetical protein WA691_03755 [Thermoplasmata archaeon]
MIVNPSLSIGALVGVVISGGFVYAEIGRFATPQVPETLFDERREVFAYTAGLFVGIPLAIAFLFFLDSMANGALPGAALFLVALVAGTEVAQWALLRAHYWGVGESGPFYALGYRAGIAGIFSLAIVAQYLAGPTLTWDGVTLVLLESFAILSIQVAAALLSLPPSPTAGRKGGGPVPGAIFQAVGFFVLGVGALSGVASPSAEAVTYGAAIIALLGGLLVYHRLRTLLSAIPAPSAGVAPPPRPVPAVYGRTTPGPPGPADPDDPSGRRE